MILKNKNILITGAGKGIGFSAVENCIKEDGFVYALVKSKKDIKKFSNFKKDKLKIYNGDVRNVKIINKIFLDSLKFKKPINCLVNNAGIRFRKNFIKISKKELLNVFDINFFSIFLISQIFTKFLKKRKLNGSIINISSIVGQIGFSELSTYGASKGALIAFTKNLSAELANNKIRVNSISPGFTKTSYFEKFKKKSNLYKWTLSRIPLNRWGDPEEISNVISFLLSEKAKYITGENFNVDGGWLSS
jgi:NAD(P)-dependent dehydrogenase (short-subunit alcohol dehydrogenase family)|tara:strand:+ start:1043 stop:1786 length:744 start_codon:yes stop_codon:yes gene_type:complete